jgi:hypothetical protein
MVTRKTAKRKKLLLKLLLKFNRRPRFQNPCNLRKPGVLTNSLDIVRESSTDFEKRDSAPTTPAESIHTSPKDQYDEESEDPFDVNFDESPVIPLSREEDPRRQDTSHEDEAEADKYFKQYLTASFHPVNITADNYVRVIFP